MTPSTSVLQTPPVPRIVPDGVFDAFGWWPSDILEWGAPPAEAWTAGGPVTADNPPRMVFVMKRELSFLPRELARLHVPGMGLTDDWALAPYGIDDATDGLYLNRVPPREALWLAADSLRGVFWGLHDWAHFHSHGPFTERAWTELQCDATALAWLWANRGALSLDEGAWCRVRDDVERIGMARFAEEGVTPPASMLEPVMLQGWALG